MPIQSSLGLGFGMGLGTKAAGAVNYTPADTFATVAGAWFYAWDNTDMTINSNGTGGIPTSGTAFGRWSDRSGYGNHLTQATTNVQPVFYDNKVAMRSWYSGGATRKANLANAATSTTFNRNNMSGGMVIDCQGAADANPIISFGADKFALFRGTGSWDWANFRTIFLFDGTTSTSTGLKFTGRKCIITWRCNGSGIIINVDGVEQTLSALSSQSMTKILLSIFDFGGANQTNYREVVAFNEDVGATAIANLRTYLQGKAGTSSINTNNKVFVLGDSLSRGWLSELGKPYGDYISNRSTHLWHNYAKDGAFSYDHGDGVEHRPSVLATDLVSQKGSGENVAIYWTGHNDFADKTGAQIEAGLGAECLVLRNAGFKVIICTLPDYAGAEATFNTAVRANWSTYATAIADLRAATELSDSTNTTYFSSAPHLTAAGMAVAAGIIETAMGSI